MSEILQIRCIIGFLKKVFSLAFVKLEKMHSQKCSNITQLMTETIKYINFDDLHIYSLEFHSITYF